MALALRPVSFSVVSLLHLLLFSSGRSQALHMDMVNVPHAPPVCGESKGLTDCTLSRASLASSLHPDQSINVRSVELKAILCCSDNQDCEPCLQIFITIQGSFDGEEEELPEDSGEQQDEDESSGSKQLMDGSGQHGLRNPAVFVCFSVPLSIGYCEAVHFTPTLSVLDHHQPTPEMWWLSVIEKVTFGSRVLVKVKAHSTINQTIIDIPSLQDVCSLDLDVKQCDTPRLQAVTDHQRGVVLLQLETDSTEEVMCLIMLRDEMPGELVKWHKGQREMSIPENSVVPCLCFQVWWEGKELRRKSCPFKNQQDVYERMQRNISLSMEEAHSRHGRVLSWNVTAPCRLEAELWLCKRDATGRCDEVMGSRQKLYNHSSAGWTSMPEGHRIRGEFIDMTSLPTLCVQIQINGMDSILEPHCPFATPRWRWSLPLFIGLLIICLTLLGAYVMQGFLKGYVRGLLKEDNVKVDGGHVVLLYPPDDNQTLPALTGGLGSSLHALGFSVSLDLWSKAELSVLGPVPWLHSRLDRIQRQGGKVVLVLTQTAWGKAEEWGKWGWDRERPREEEAEEKPGGGVPAPCSDVFSATFSCILADYLQGRAGERFVLVQFEALPSQPPGCGGRPLPELFRGLQLFSLPSQSLGFLTELAARRHGGNDEAARRKRAGGLRAASRALAHGLRGLAAGPTVLRLTALSPDCVGAGAEESLETVPLQPSLTPPSPPGPDSCSRVNGVDWV